MPIYNTTNTTIWDVETDELYAQLGEIFSSQQDGEESFNSLLIE